MVGGLIAMELPADYERSDSELVFGVLKVLMVSYCLWGSANRVEQSHLSEALRTTEFHLRSVLEYLAEEGFVCLDPDAGTAQLTDYGARDLLVNSTSLDSPEPVVFSHAKWH